MDSFATCGGAGAFALGAHGVWWTREKAQLMVVAVRGGLEHFC